VSIPTRSRWLVAITALALSIPGGVSAVEASGERTASITAGGSPFQSPVNADDLDPYTVMGGVWGPSGSQTDNIKVEARDSAGTIQSTSLSYGGMINLFLAAGTYQLTYTAPDPEIVVEHRTLVVQDTGDPDSPQFTNENVRLRYVPARATTAPTLSGVSKVGGELVATTGSWDQPGMTFRFNWLRAGRSIFPGGTASARYRLTVHDVGRRVSVSVIASAPDGSRYPGVAASARRRVAKAASSTHASLARGGGARRTLQVTVRSRPVTAVGGRVAVAAHHRAIASARLRHGRATVKLPHLSRGHHTLTVSYPGSKALGTSRARLVVRIGR
jgi:hypothetical protein